MGLFRISAMVLVRAWVAMTVFPFLGNCTADPPTPIGCGETESLILGSGQLLSPELQFLFTPADNVIATAKACTSRPLVIDSTPFTECRAQAATNNCLSCGAFGGGYEATWTASAGVAYNITLVAFQTGSLEMVCVPITMTTSTVTTTTTSTMTTATTTATTITLTTATSVTATTTTITTATIVTATVTSVTATVATITTTSATTTASTTSVGTDDGSPPDESPPASANDVGGCMTLTFDGSNVRGLIAAYRKTIAKAANVDESLVQVTASPGSICASVQGNRRLQENQGQQVAMVFVIRYPPSMEQAAAQTRNTLAAIPPAEVARILAEEVSQVEGVGQVSVSTDLVMGNAEAIAVTPVANTAEEQDDGGQLWIPIVAGVVGVLAICAGIGVGIYLWNKKQKAAPAVAEAAPADPEAAPADPEAAPETAKPEKSQGFRGACVDL